MCRLVALLVAVVVAAGCGQAVGPTVPVSGPSQSLPSPAASVATTPTPTAAEPSAAGGIDAITARVQGIADALASTSAGITVFVRVGTDERTVVAGLANRAPAVEMAPDVRLQVASLTKPMTATAVMALVESGTLSLDDPVSRWLPDMLRDGDEITIEQLLTHSSGLANFTQLDGWSWDDPSTATELVAFAEAAGPAFEPGARAEYSNTGYVLLGLVIEAATGRSLRRAMRELVFRPAGMASADLGTRPLAGFEQARGYIGSVDVTTDSLDGLAAAGGVVATAEDVGHFLDALLDGRLVDPALVADMAAEHSRLYGEDSYGFGLYLSAESCGPQVGHFGLLPGFAASAWRRADGTRTVVVLINDETNWGDATNALVAAALCD